MTKVMRSMLSHILMRNHLVIKEESCLAERVIERLLNNALAGDLPAIRFIFLVMDGGLEPGPLDPAGRPMIDVVDPDD